MIKTNLVLLLAKFRKMNLKYLFKLLCITCFVYQSIETTLEYLEYKTEVEIRTIDHITNGEMETIPALSFCSSLIPKDNKKPIKLESVNGEDYKRLGINCGFSKYHCDLSYKVLLELLNNQTYLSDYLNVIDLQFAVTDLNCSVISNGMKKKCNHLINLTLSHNSNYKCYTFLSQLSTDSYESFNLSHYAGFQNLNDFAGILFVHDSNQLPSYSISQIFSMPINDKYSNILYDKFVFKRLPLPFDTNCQNYNRKIRSQAQCVNDLIIEIFKKQNCFPKNFETLTFVIKNYNYTEFKFKFCNQNFSFPDPKDLKQNCRTACYEEIYVTKKVKIDIQAPQSTNPYFISFEYYPKLGFLQYLVTLGGLLGL